MKEEGGRILETNLRKDVNLGLDLLLKFQVVVGSNVEMIYREEEGEESEEYLQRSDWEMVVLHIS